MKTMHLFRVLFFALVVTSLTAFTGCKDKESEEEIPTLEVTPMEISFDVAGGTKTFEIKTSGKWTITGADEVKWLAVTPALSGQGSQTITLTAGQSTAANNVKLKVTAFANIFGIDKEIASKNVVVTQGAQPSAEVIYGNNFDKTPAVKTGDTWPFLDQFDGWKNQTGTGAAAVTYVYTNMSVRQSGKLSGGYDDASGANKLWFGTAPATFTIQNITLPAGQLNYRIVFGGSYSKSVGEPPVYDNIFKMDMFKVAVGNGTAWAENVTYEKIGGDDTKEPFWNYYAVNFTLKAATTALSIKFTANDSSGFSLDDVKLTEGAGGQEITFTGGGNPEPGVDKTVTIPELIAKITPTATILDASSNCIFEAIVVTDKAGGNTVKNNLQVMTPGATTEKNGITLFGSGKYTNPEDPGFTFKAGDKVKVTLKANMAKIGTYEGTHQVTGAENTEWVVIEKIGVGALSPIVISVDKLAAYQAMPVAIKGVTSPSTAGEWCKANAFGQLPFTVNGTAMTVFIQANMPGLVGVPYAVNTTGDIVGLAAVYKNNGQLCPQVVEDVAAFLPNTPMITSMTPSSLNFKAAGETLTTTASTINADGLAITAEVAAPFTATVNGMIISVTAPENTGTAAVTGTLTVKLMKDGAAVHTKTVALTQSKPAGNETEIIADFSVEANYPSDFPTLKANQLLDPKTFLFGGYEFTFAGAGTGNGYYKNYINFTEKTDPVVMLGKNGAYIELPAVAGKSLASVTYTTYSNASKKVTVGIYDSSNTAVSGGEAILLDQAGGKLEYTYTLTGTAVGAKYRVYVANDNNTQILKLKMTYN